MAKVTKKAPVKKTTAGPTEFSKFCVANKVDGTKARRRLRSGGLKAPYDPKDRRVLDLIKPLMA